MATIESTIQDCRDNKFFASQVNIYVQYPGEKRQERQAGLKWNGSKASLIELIYGLHLTGVFGNSGDKLGQIVKHFEESFQIELGNFYNVFQEIRLRKKNRTNFLELLKNRLIQHMDEADERVTG